MERVIRRYLWALHLSLVACAAFLAARTVNLFVETAIASAPSAPELRASARWKAPEPVAKLQLLARISQVTGIALPSPDQPRRDVSAGPMRTALPLKLLGTLLSSSPGWSIAALLNVTQQRSTTVMVGDRIQGSEVLEILRERVIISRDGQREFIDGQPGAGVLGPSPDAITRPLTDPARQGQPLGVGIRCLDENTCVVPRIELDRTLNHLDELATQAHIGPAYKDGQPEGFRFFSIRPDSLYSKIGLVNGDVVKRINGFEMNTPEKALEAYTRLKDADRIDVELDRSGTSIRKSYSVR